jgi:signal transduction histidine kinase
VTINSALDLLAPQIKRQDIEVQVIRDDSLPLVMGRPDQLEQVFINMGFNALDAMLDGGVFTIELEKDDRVEDGAEKSSSIVIRLKDTGVGMPPEDIALLFEPFYTTKERGAGSGLGLFVSYLIIDQHGGTIEVESEQGRGTTFAIKLPIADAGEEN